MPPPKWVTIEIAFPPAVGVSDSALTATNPLVQRVLRAMDQALANDGFTRTTPPSTFELITSTFENGHTVNYPSTITNTNMIAVYQIKNAKHMPPTVFLDRGQLSVVIYDFGNDRPYTDKTSKQLRSALEKEFGGSHVKVKVTGG